MQTNQDPKPTTPTEPIIVHRPPNPPTVPAWVIVDEYPIRVR